VVRRLERAAGVDKQERSERPQARRKPHRRRCAASSPAARPLPDHSILTTTHRGRTPARHTKFLQEFACFLQDASFGVAILGRAIDGQQPQRCILQILQSR
jgi:hypothetical protein